MEARVSVRPLTVTQKSRVKHRAGRRTLCRNRKSNRKKSWQTVDDDGKTAKKIVESGKADKYTTKGKKKKSDGTTETGAKGVTWKSFVDGMSQIGDFSSSAVGVSSC